MSQKQMKNNKAITLISLVITIIILIILAGVTLSIVLGENGLLARAKKGAEDYQYAGLRERIESEILALDMEKVIKGEMLTITDALIGVQENGVFEEIDIDSCTGVCEGYVIELGYNENEKVVIKGIEKDTGTRIVAKLNPTGYTNEKVEITITVKANEKNVTKIEVPTEMKQKEGTSEQDHIYEVETNGTYSVTATFEDGTSIEKEITIATIDKLSPNSFNITAENTGSGIIITAETQDAEADTTNAQSGMDKYEYYVKKSTEQDSAYQKYETNEINSLEVGKYQVYVKAYDKAGNHTQSNTIEVEVKLKLKFQQIAAGSSHSCAIDMDGNVWTWGLNTYGQLGNGTTEDKTSPIKITIPSNPDIKFSKIAAGYWFTLAIDIEGNLWAWGQNKYGQLGDGTTENKTSPEQIMKGTTFKEVSATYHSLALDTEGNVWVWGRNTSESVGNGAKEETVSTPIKVTVPSNPDIKFSKISVGTYHNLVLDTEGNLWVWGSGGSGKLGKTTNENEANPVQIKTETTFKKIEATEYNNYAIDENGNLWGWGLSSRLGNGDKSTNTEQVTPVQIKTDTKFTQLTGTYHTLAIDENGNLWGWGDNDDGQIGNGNKVSQSSPVPITISEKPDIKFSQIASTSHHSLALDTEGNLWAWGRNTYGQLGDGTTDDKLTPVPIAQ